MPERDDADVCRACGQWQGDCECECPHCTHSPVPAGSQCTRCGRWHHWGLQYRRRAVRAIHEAYLNAEHVPCKCCGGRCGSQLEFVESNGGLPWEFCSGCDPGIREDGESDWCSCGMASAIVPELSRRQIRVIRAMGTGAGFPGGWRRNAWDMESFFCSKIPDRQLAITRETRDPNPTRSRWPNYELTELGKEVFERLPKEA